MVKFVPAADVHQFGQLVHAVTGQSAAQAGKRARTEAAKSRIPKRNRHAGDAAPGDAANPAREPVDAPAQSGCQPIGAMAWENQDGKGTGLTPRTKGESLLRSLP